MTPVRPLKLFLCVLCVLCSGASVAFAQATTGIALFEQNCGTCHNSNDPANRAPSRAALSQRTPESILAAITDGPMAVNAQRLSPQQKRILAEQLTLRPLGSATGGGIEQMTNRCSAKPLVDPAKTPMWSGWGADTANTRFQPASATSLNSDNVQRLKLKWAFAFPNGVSAFGQPAVAGGRVFVGSDNGYVYALDAATGCAYWSFHAGGGVRAAISVGAIGTASAPRFAVYFGDLKGNVYAVDAESGALVWSQHTDPHPLVRITGAPTLLDGRLYVPLSSLEEGAGSSPQYECCTFRGAVVAYDARNGTEIWRTHTIPSPPKKLKKNAMGTQLWGPAGAAVWSAPTVDVRRGLIYIATGNGYNDPAAETSDSVMALDLKTGKMRWYTQVMANDAYVVGCGPTAAVRDNCPEATGPDFDFGNSPILRRLPNGRSVITLGQKSGIAWALDPDREGATLWKKGVGKGSALGGVEWGSAADEENGYYPVADASLGAAEAGGLYALKLTTGEEVWRWRPTNDCSTTPRNCIQALSAAISVIPGVVFAGTTTGMLRAHSTKDGKVLWETNTAQEFTTVNGVPGKGGSINGPGPVVAGNMLLTNSGYAYLGTGLAGNVLLAFTPE